MRVLFSCRPGLGHFHPLVDLASTLIDSSHLVLFASSPDSVEAIRSAGFDADPVGLTDWFTDWQMRERLIREVPELVSTPPERMRFLMFPRVFAGLEVPPRVEGLLPILREWQPELIVHEMAEFAAPLAAALEGIPTVNHSWGPIVAPDVMAEAGAFAAGHWRAAGLPTPDRGGMYDGLYIDVCPPSLQAPHISTVPRVQPMRPVPTSSVHEADAPWLAELGRRPVVTVTLGTLFNKRLDLFQVIIEGLAALDLDVIVALGPGVEISSVGPLPSNTQAFSWVPWRELLEKTTVVISHGGASSTLGPLSLGIPVVMVPLGADHFVNAERVLAAKAGVVLDRSTVSPLAVCRGVEAALSAPVREAAKRVAEEIVKMPAPSQIVSRIEAYARHRP
jgi:UDP:flavonoid glycosyltransferase YjiC (YdhE family)